ncbi:hypothetical protein GCM10008090_26220 [Arenicella chitinivorans]|uniref:NlpC/P60 domain-containing protein n=1 Tax=Arenicella chitinivorans TaxID=1329800 RepID=A0A918RY03_9GAMM|nr:BPSL0067 family protein [Arenicella chitinivorans]GHA15423.1 hypothetical protein GCM10008090_26220 [Arenicella chitinivorans]
MNNTHRFTASKRIYQTLLVCAVLGSMAACVASRSWQTDHRALMSDLVCKDAHQYRDRVVGDGHCVSLIKRCSGAPDTVDWRPGETVLNADLTPGTIIATFKGNRYPSRRGYHAAIYIEQDERGIWVWDQWVGKPVHRRLIRIRGDDALPSNSAQAYRVVKLR